MFQYQYTVTEFINNIKQTLLESFPIVDIIGEVTAVALHQKSGHLYFSLKDDNAVISCVCWNKQVAKYQHILQNGDTVKLRGKITVFPSNNKIFITTQDVTPQGAGSIAKALAIVKEQLTKEGYFAKPKRILTAYPKSIGIITSKDGAVIEDIKKNLEGKFPCDVFLCDVAVQGIDSVESIIRAINKFHTLAKRVDFLIVARGGGSEEDLYHFNDINLVKAISNSEIPIVTAIGHETNLSLADMVADLSVSTPTASIKHIANRVDLIESLNKNISQIKYQIQNLIYLNKERITLHSRALQTPEKYIRFLNRKAKNLFNILSNNVIDMVYKKQLKLSRINVNLKNPIALIEHRQLHLQNASFRLNAIHGKINNYSQNLNSMNRFLQGLSFHKTLERGFSIIKQNNTVINDVNKLTSGSYSIEFHSGVANVEIVVKK